MATNFKIVSSRIKGLCVLCNHGLVREYENGDTETICSANPAERTITRPVIRCTDYTDRRRDDKYQMEKIAWTIRTDKKGKFGFQPPVKKDNND